MLSRYGFSEIQRLLSLTQSYIKAKTGREVERPWKTLQKFRDCFHLQLILENSCMSSMYEAVSIHVQRYTAG